MLKCLLNALSLEEISHQVWKQTNTKWEKDKYKIRKRLIQNEKQTNSKWETGKYKMRKTQIQYTKNC